MIKDLDWLVYEGTVGEQRLIVKEIDRENYYPIYKYNDKYYRTEDMGEIEKGLFDVRQQTTNIKFNSVSGILAETHTKSNIVWCGVRSGLFDCISSDRILQVLLVNENYIFVEYVNSDKDVAEVFSAGDEK